MANQYLVVDLGGTFVKYALMTNVGEILHKGKVPTDSSERKALLETMTSLRDAVASQGQEYAGVAVSMPGRIDTATGIAHTGGSFMWMHDEPFADELEKIFQKPVTIANDGKCAAYAEAWRGALADVASGCVIVIGTGIGGGIVLDHQVLMGATGSAGELTFIPVDYQAIHEPVPDPKHGADAMWASRVSATAITKAYARAKELKKADGVMLLDAYETGEPEAVAVMDQFGRDVAAGIFGIQSVVDVQRFSIGDGISARPEVTTIVRDAVDELWGVHSWTPLSKPEIASCKFGNEANLIGALAFHLNAR